MSMAIITGASSGLGREYTLAVHQTHPEIDEFLLIARRRERLEALAAQLHGKTVHILPLDLTRPESRDQIVSFLKEHRAQVRLLVNNSGYGWMGAVDESNPEMQAEMVNLNCGALTAMCAMVLPYMSGGGVILNVCSIAAFVPTPRMSTYCSTKAYVFSFSKSLREEVRANGINVLAACPGPMDTEFLDVAGITGKSKLFARLPRVSPEQMARKSLQKAFAGRAVYTNLPFYKFYRVMGKLLPHNWLMKLTTV